MLHCLWALDTTTTSNATAKTSQQHDDEQRAVLGKGPAQFRKFFRIEPVVGRRSERFNRHKLQVREFIDGRQLDCVTRSALGLASIYKLLPVKCVEHSEVKPFQRCLQDFLRFCIDQTTQWQHIFSPRLALHSHPLIKFR